MSGGVAPSSNPFLAGHSSAISDVVEAFSSGRMHHAWLICGMDGIGKATLAFHIAHFILSQGANRPGNLDMRHPAARLIAAEAHPDLFILRRRVDEKTGVLKNTISAEDARSVNDFMHKTAAYGGWRVVMIDEAHALNSFGQNAILKFVEEPPERTVVLVTARSRGALLPTIRSRCRLLPLSPLSRDEMREALAKCGAGHHDPADVERVIELSGGSVGFALGMLDDEVLPVYDEVMAIIRDMPRLDLVKAHAISDRLARKSDTGIFSTTSTLLIDAMRREICAKAAGQDAKPSTPFAKAIAGEDALRRMVRLKDTATGILEAADMANLDRKLAFLGVLTEIRRTAG